MLPDLRLLIPATVATFFVAAAAGLFASVRVAQDSVEVHADGRIANDESAFTRISMSWPMPGANRAIAMQELSAFVRKATLAPLKAAAAEPIVAISVAPSAEETAALQPKPESMPETPPDIVAAAPEPSSDSDGRPDLPPLANAPDQAEPGTAMLDDEEQEKEESLAVLSEPEAPEGDQAEVIASEAPEPEPEIESIPDEMGSIGSGTRTASEPEPAAEIPLPVVASRPAEPEDVTKPEPERAVPEVVVRKPPRRTYRTRRYRIVQQPRKPKIKPAPDITELEPYVRYSRSPANIFFTPIY